VVEVEEAGAVVVLAAGAAGLTAVVPFDDNDPNALFKEFIAVFIDEALILYIM
jgi:hypothetical protein